MYMLAWYDACVEKALSIFALKTSSHFKTLPTLLLLYFTFYISGANLKGSNMEDPAGSKAIMEGVNLKGH